MKHSYELSIKGHIVHGINAHTPWSFGYYASGELISQQARDAYRRLSIEDTPDNPFEWSNHRLVKLLKGAVER
jgi:hypothetical protein